MADTRYAAGFELSPDGQRLIWHRAVGTDAGLAVGTVPAPGASASATAAPGRTGNDVIETANFATGRLAWSAGNALAWLPNSRHFVYAKDITGDENTQLFVLDAYNPQKPPVAVTPWRNARSLFVAQGAAESSKFFYQSNRRDPAANDLYEFDATTGQSREVARSSRDVIAWIIDVNGELGARLRQTGATSDTDRVLELRDAASGEYREFKRVSAFEALWVHRLDRQRGRVMFASNNGRDKIALIEKSLADGRERVVFESPSVDLNWAVYPNGQSEPLGARTEPDYPRFDILDRDLQAELLTVRDEALRTGLWDTPPITFGFSHVQAGAQRMLVHAIFSDGVREYFYSRADKRLHELSSRRESGEVATFAKSEPFGFQSSDGLTVSGYITLPKSAGPKPPLVVVIHGGPWARDVWLSGDLNGTQFLANRGYAVMTVNYRGSTGYGQIFMNAGIKTLHDRSQRDIYEAVQWAVNKALVDPKRIAAFGGSFGGFSTMAQLIQYPQTYQCGINVVGVANWPRVIEKRPPQWENFMHMFERFYGDVRNPQERQRRASFQARLR